MSFERHRPKVYVSDASLATASFFTTLDTCLSLPVMGPSNSSSRFHAVLRFFIRISIDAKSASR
jgi:hypothetical protein